VNDLDLDEFDRAILRLLQTDNSLTLRLISEQVNLSVAAVQKRIQRLRKNGVIRAEVALLDPDKVGRPITIIVEVHVEHTPPGKELEALKAQFTAPEIQQCYYVTGNADFLLVVTVATMAEYQALAHRLFDNRPLVRWYRTTVVMERIKAELSVPV
jgi:DNA-binding Lrp family transcriptional regulator